MPFKPAKLFSWEAGKEELYLLWVQAVAIEWPGSQDSNP